MQPITYGCFYYVLKNNPLYKVLPIVTMGIPPTGLLAAIFLLGEKPTQELFTGGALIIVGVILIVFTKNKKMRLKNENRIYWSWKCWGKTCRKFIKK
jgi:O-acetylserine/cysteine efflux transporter